MRVIGRGIVWLLFWGGFLIIAAGGCLIILQGMVWLKVGTFENYTLQFDLSPYSPANLAKKKSKAADW